MKRLISLFAAVLLTLSLCACGNDGQPSSSLVSGSPSPSASPSATPSASPSATPSASPTPSPSPVDSSSSAASSTKEAEEPVYSAPEETGNDTSYQEPVTAPTAKPTAAPTPAPTPVPTPEPTPEPAAASPYDYVGYDIGTFYSLFGYPNSSEYATSCSGQEGEDGILYYSGFTVYTFRSTNGSEVVVSVF